MDIMILRDKFWVPTPSVMTETFEFYRKVTAETGNAKPDAHVLGPG